MHRIEEEAEASVVADTVPVEEAEVLPDEVAVPVVEVATPVEEVVCAIGEGCWWRSQQRWRNPRRVGRGQARHCRGW